MDGVSLTVSAVGPATFSVSLIPTTLALTTLGRKGVGDQVNLEVDVLAKYVERLLARGQGAAGAPPARRSHDRRPSTIEQALEAMRAGRPVLVLDSEDRENEGDLVLAAQTATEEWMAWTIRHSSGYLCAPMPDDVADRLELPLMVADNRDPLRTAYTVSVDAATGVTTGISAADRRPAPSRCSPTPASSPPTSSVPVTCCRCGPGPVAC